MTNTKTTVRLVAVNSMGETLRLDAGALGNMDTVKAHVKVMTDLGWRIRIHDLSRRMVWETNKRSGLLLLKRFPMPAGANVRL